MTLSEYQEQAIKTAIYPAHFAVLYPALGLCGEAGEVAEKVKKSIRDDGGVWKKDEIAKELGDVLWYLANIADDLGVSLEDVAAENLKKLSSRAERGTLRGSGDNR